MCRTGYLFDVNLHIVIASICERVIIDILLLGYITYILSSTYICQIYLSYICYLFCPIGIVIMSIIIVNVRFELLFSTQFPIFNSVFQLGFQLGNLLLPCVL